MVQITGQSWYIYPIWLHFPHQLAFLCDENVFLRLWFDSGLILVIGG